MPPNAIANITAATTEIATRNEISLSTATGTNTAIITAILLLMSTQLKYRPPQLSMWQGVSYVTSCSAN